MATENDTSKRAAVLALLKEGCITPSEVARLAGTSRQLVAHWCSQEKINTRRAREIYLKGKWRYALMQLDQRAGVSR